MATGNDPRNVIWALRDRFSRIVDDNDPGVAMVRCISGSVAVQRFSVVEDVKMGVIKGGWVRLVLMSLMVVRGTQST